MSEEEIKHLIRGLGIGTGVNSNGELEIWLSFDGKEIDKTTVSAYELKEVLNV